MVVHKIFGVKSSDPEYWGLREMVTHEMAVVLNKMKLRKWYTFEDLLKMNPEYEPTAISKLYDEMANVGIIEYDHGDNYAHDHPMEDAPKIKRYKISFYVPGSAELFNSTQDRVDKNPVVTNFFERVTFIPLVGIAQMVPLGGDDIGMHVIPVEKAIGMHNQAIDVEKISSKFYENIEFNLVYVEKLLTI